MKKRALLLMLALLTTATQVMAQCAMCRSTLENNASRGETDLAAGLNTGILYLFFTPYVVGGVIIFLWIRHSRKNAQKKKLRPGLTRG